MLCDWQLGQHVLVTCGFMLLMVQRLKRGAGLTADSPQEGGGGRVMQTTGAQFAAAATTAAADCALQLPHSAPTMAGHSMVVEVANTFLNLGTMQPPGPVPQPTRQWSGRGCCL